ncbi:MAG TPA: hypothetical protein PLO23_11625 [Alphaproteobacteria bacterium]|nr:hypothetical protein [Alphaproteobacteria bacterium]
MKFSKWKAGIIGLFTAGGVAAVPMHESYHQLKDRMIADNTPMFGEMDRSTLCSIESAAQSHALRHTLHRANTSIQKLLKHQGADTDVMIDAFEVTKHELQDAIEEYAQDCEKKYGKSMAKKIRDGFSGLLDKTGDVLISLGIKQAAVFLFEHLYLILLVENEHQPGDAPKILVASAPAAVKA